MLQRGFVLIIIMLLSAVMAVLALTMLRTSIQSQMMTRFWQQRLRAQAAMMGTVKMLAQHINQLHCPLHKLITHLNNQDDWWQHHRHCRFKDYQYIIESLTVNPCIKVLPGDKLGGIIYRLTVRSMRSGQLAPLLVQSTYLLPTSQKMICKSQQLTLRSGRLSWRQ